MSLCMNCMKEREDREVCPFCGYQETFGGENPAYLPPHTVLNGRYLIGRVLGQGGFGITYIGFDQVLNTRVAIKEYYPGDLAQRTPGDTTVMPYTGQARDDFGAGRAKFVEEARTLAKFSDFPGIVSVKDCFEANGTAYLVMQYLEGISLKEYLDQKGGTLPPDQAVAILTPVMDALKEVHKSGIIHRDISPDNIFITTEGQVKLIDFGAARQSLGSQSRSLSVMLKPGYAPEEQYRSRGNQGPWTDVYALSATLYRMVTGSVPPDSLERLSGDTLEIPPSLPETLRVALQIGLAVRAPERYATVGQLQGALMNQPNTSAVIPQPQRQSAPPASFGQPAKTKHSRITPTALLIGGSVFVLAVVLLIAVILLIQSRPTAVPPAPAVPSPSAPVATPVPTPEPVVLPDLYSSALTYQRMDGIRNSVLVTLQSEYNAIDMTIRGYCDAYAQFVAGGSRDQSVYNRMMEPYLKLNSKGYQQQWNYFSKYSIGSFQVNQLSVNSVRKSGNVYFVWDYEVVSELKSGRWANTSSHWVYRIEYSDGQYQIVDYISDPAY